MIKLSVKERCDLETDDYTKSIEIQNIGNNINIYPNPTNSEIIIENDRYWVEAKVNIYDLYGRKIIDEQIFTNSNQLNLYLYDLPENIYMINIYSSGARY